MHVGPSTPRDAVRAQAGPTGIHSVQHPGGGQYRQRERGGQFQNNFFLHFQSAGENGDQGCSLGVEQGYGVGSGKSPELFPLAQSGAVKGQDPKPFGFRSSAPTQAPGAAPGRTPASPPWAQGKSKPAQVHSSADYLPRTPRWGEDRHGAGGAGGHAPPELMPHLWLLEGRRKPGRAASSLGLPPLRRPAWGRG